MPCIALIGKYQMTINKTGRKYTMKGKKDMDVYLQAINMTDPAIGWIEICSAPEARGNLVTISIEIPWVI